MKPIISESFLSYLENRSTKMARYLYKCFTNPNTNLLTDAEINYLTFRADGTISFLPKGSEHHITDEGLWSRTNRQTGKPSKIIKKIMKPKLLNLFSNKDFEAFHNNYKASGNSEYEFILKDNTEIPDVYDGQYCAAGTLGDSCMRNCGEYLRIYENCNKLKILTLISKESGIIHGRALVWDVGEFIFMDRVYTSHDFMYDLFLQYAEDEGWWRKQDYKSYTNKTTLVTPEGEIVYKEMVINTPTDFEFYPYIDTFSYGEDGYLSNIDNNCYTYNYTDGSRDEPDSLEGKTYCECDDAYLDDDDVICINAGYREGQFCHIDDSVYMGGCYFYKDDPRIVWINDVAYDIEGSDLVYSDNLDKYILIDEAVFVENKDDYYPVNIAVYVESEDKYFLIEDTEYDEEQNVYILKNVEVC